MLINETNPQLGANLDLNNFNISGTGSVNVIGSGNFTQGLYINNTGVSLDNHTHQISNVSGLQTELDSKQPSGSYALSGHTHLIENVSGLQIALDNKQPSGSYASAVHTHTSSDIIEFNSSVSGLLPVINVVGSSNINVSSANKTFTVASTGLVKSDVTTTSGASVVNNIVVISEASYNALSVKDSNTIYFVT
jgi:hypothetical protein